MDNILKILYSFLTIQIIFTLVHALSLNVDTLFKFVWGSFWSPNKMEKHILTDEFDDPEFLNFAIKSYSKMFGYIATGRINIRINRDIKGEMWFGVG